MTMTVAAKEASLCQRLLLLCKRSCLQKGRPQQQLKLHEAKKKRQQARRSIAANLLLIFSCGAATFAFLGCPSNSPLLKADIRVADPIPNRNKSNRNVSYGVGRKAGRKYLTNYSVITSRNNGNEAATESDDRPVAYYLQGKRFLSAPEGPAESVRELMRDLMDRDQAESSSSYFSSHFQPDPELVFKKKDDAATRDAFKCISLVEGAQWPQHRVSDEEMQWLLPRPLWTPRRNHDCVVIEGNTGEQESEDKGVTLINLLGRFSRSVESVDLITGETREVITAGVDPEGFELADLNHVYAVVVSSLPQEDDSNSDMNGEKNRKNQNKEIWVPCGFHGDRVNKEFSNNYVRIVDVDTLEIRLGPRLPVSGGACVAAALHLDGPNHPPHVCIFGGTDGTHDGGVFLTDVSCYDRRKEAWHQPMEPLPFGLDHGNLARLPPGLCHEDDPERVLIMNYRTYPYGAPHSEVLAHDLYRDGSASATRVNDVRGWYVYSNVTERERNSGNPIFAPRDAGGMVLANGGRYLVNFGGIQHSARTNTTAKNQKRYNLESNVRVFDTCQRTWREAPGTDLGAKAFALQTCASASLNVAYTCGGHSECDRYGKNFFQNRNSPWCVVNRLPSGLLLDNRDIVNAGD